MKKAVMRNRHSCVLGDLRGNVTSSTHITVSRTDSININILSAASWLEKYAARSLNFPTDDCKFSTKETVGARNFNSVLKFPKMELLAPFLYFLKKIFRQAEI